MRKEKSPETYEDLTEEQIIKLKENQEQMAEILFAMWLEEINKNTV